MIKAIIGLGNPGSQYAKTRHNIGFRILDALAQANGASWRSEDNRESAQIMLHDKPVLLIKPTTYMNLSGKVIPALTKKGIQPEEILVVHDELELPFGQIKIKQGGSAKGHNGLKSIIEHGGPEFYRLRFGIGRPDNKEEVPDYVLSNFKESNEELDRLIDQALGEIESLIKQ